MDIIIYPKKLNGKITAIPSKSQAHRLLICAAFSDKPTQIFCFATNDDIEATAECLRSLGAQITYNNGIYQIIPVKNVPKTATLRCKESGSTLRFLLPIVGALGVDATFILEGRLPHRPLSPLWEEMERMGCALSRPTENTIRCKNKLTSGDYHIRGDVSSQFISGLYFALSLILGVNTLEIEGKIESLPYIEMTKDALSKFGVSIHNGEIRGTYPFSSPEVLTVEGDWSNAAFFLAAKTLENPVEVLGLSNDSKQGDRKISDILTTIHKHQTIDVSDIPDLMPILAVTGGALAGISFTNIQRLRLKESDRVASVEGMLTQLGSSVSVSDKEMTVLNSEYHGCTIDSVGDHRIAMAAAIAATASTGPIIILGAECVAKSYPSFWDEYRRLGGNYEQYIR